MRLEDFGITRLPDGRIRTNGGEVHIPSHLFWFPLDVETLHLPGSEDGFPEVFEEADFIGYCQDMAE